MSWSITTRLVVNEIISWPLRSLRSEQLRPLKGEVPSISGAGRAIGRSIDGSRYRLSTRRDLAETAARVERLGRRVVTSGPDVRDVAAISAAFEDARGNCSLERRG
jgi:hypothetical protein